MKIHEKAARLFRRSRKRKHVVHVPDGKWEILDKAMRGIRSWKLPAGDYLEFGVYRGLSFIHAYQLSKKYELDSMRYYAFDSFEGLPDDGEQAEAKYDHFHQGQYACGQAEFQGLLENAGVDLSNVTIVPGFYDQTLSAGLKGQLPLQRAAVVWIDCDYYRSTVPVLDFVTDYLTTGSFLIFDDWFSFGADPEAGEMRATAEWLERNPDISLVEYHKFHTGGISFLVQKHKRAVPQAHSTFQAREMENFLSSQPSLAGKR